jgi:hypothetical protein
VNKKKFSVSFEPRAFSATVPMPSLREVFAPLFLKSGCFLPGLPRPWQACFILISLEFRMPWRRKKEYYQNLLAT